MMLLTLWGLATLVFLMIKLIPGDEGQMAANTCVSRTDRGRPTAARPRSSVIMQYFGFLGRLLQGDLGTSITTFQPVLADLGRVLPATLELVVFAMIINLSVALPVGIIAAARRGGKFDGISRIGAVVAGGLPAFWLALMLQYLLGSVWRVLPISGQHSYGMAPQS